MSGINLYIHIYSYRALTIKKKPFSRESTPQNRYVRKVLRQTFRWFRMHNSLNFRFFFYIVAYRARIKLHINDGNCPNIIEFLYCEFMYVVCDCFWPAGFFLFNKYMTNCWMLCPVSFLLVNKNEIGKKTGEKNPLENFPQHQTQQHLHGHAHRTHTLFRIHMTPVTKQINMVLELMFACTRAAVKCSCVCVCLQMKLRPDARNLLCDAINVRINQTKRK